VTEQIPVTPLVEEYRRLLKLSQAQRLERAEQLIRRPTSLAKAFRDSRQQFASFDHADENFYDPVPPRTTLPKNPKGLSSTIEVAARLSGRGARRVLGDDRLSFLYIDRELVPARTKSGAVFADGKSIRSGLRLDLLLANRHDRTPIIGEVKVAQDKDPFFALVQALTHAAYLSTPSQFKRLARVYSERKIKAGKKLDVYLLLAQAPAAATYWFELREAARRLAARLVEQESMTGGVRRIAAVDLDLIDERMRISKRFSYPEA
jgi:hypothetical protein